MSQTENRQVGLLAGRRPLMKKPGMVYTGMVPTRPGFHPSLFFSSFFRLILAWHTNTTPSHTNTNHTLDEAAVVVDPGSHRVKLGTAGDECPALLVESATDTGDLLVERGLVTDWETSTWVRTDPYLASAYLSCPQVRRWTRTLQCPPWLCPVGTFGACTSVGVGGLVVERALPRPGCSAPLRSCCQRPRHC
eukprot:TRINITY_DN7083_c0_g1_i6.p2 TRINITY_DN7083_c0_g1~~TRINITY_DN7083_c0_g1_i6.p2  ORF type:complete len:192 (+),score=4.59 TRINITY_DN7083_c0_g1_i6:321-896(+)